MNKPINLLRYFCLSLVWGVMVTLSACQSHVKVPQPAPEKLAVSKILVLPFQDLSAVYGQNQSARCPICGQVFVTGEVAPSASETMTDQLMELLERREDQTPIPPGQGRGVLAGLLATELGLGPELDMVLETGARLGAEAVMIGHIYRYEERQGRSYSIRRPAAVTFGLNLVRVPDGKLLWSGAYEEVQQSLTENLFRMGTFFKRGGKWLTAGELSASGLGQVLDTLR